MTIVYQLLVDKRYYHQLMSRFYAQRPWIARHAVQYGFLATLLAGLWLVLTQSGSLRALATAAVVVLLTALGLAYLTRVGMIYRFSRRADFGADVTVTISPVGVSGSGENVSGQSGWGAYPNAVRYDDGILLMRAGFVRWLPDSAIRAGTVAEATALVASKSAMRHIS